jgi:hypothetical protein
MATVPVKVRNGQVVVSQVQAHGSADNKLSKCKDDTPRILPAPRPFFSGDELRLPSRYMACTLQQNV